MSIQEKWDYDEDGLPAIWEESFEEDKMMLERKRRGLPSDNNTGVYVYELKQMLEQVPDTARIGLRWGEDGKEVCYELDAQFSFEKNILIEPRKDSRFLKYVLELYEEEYEM